MTGFYYITETSFTIFLFNEINNQNRKGHDHDWVNRHYSNKIRYRFYTFHYRLTEQQLKTFLKLFMDFSNNSRRWPLSGWKPIELPIIYNSDTKPAISFGKNMQRAFEDGTLNKKEIVQRIRKLGLDVVE